MNAIAVAGGQIQGTRRRQEDTWAIAETDRGSLLLVADGLGGHPGGDVASREAVAAFRKAFLARLGAGHDAAEALALALHRADRRVRAAQRLRPRLYGMATTLVAAHISSTRQPQAAGHTPSPLAGEGGAAGGAGGGERGETARLRYISVGDSLLLRWRSGAFARINRLHTAGGGITSCVGFDLTEVDADDLTVEPGDRWLLASDGLLTLPLAEVAATLSVAADPATAVQTLLAALERRGDPYQDNVTLVAAFV